MARPSLLFVTDLAYPARGRRYGDEDVWLSGRLREAFDLALCSPLDAAALMDGFDLVLVRNSGPVIYHQNAYDAFLELEDLNPYLSLDVLDPARREAFVAALVGSLREALDR